MLSCPDRTFPGLWGPWDLDLDHGWPHTRVLAISSMVSKHPSTWRFVSSRTTREEQVFDIWGCSQGSPAPSSRYLRHSYVLCVWNFISWCCIIGLSILSFASCTVKPHWTPSTKPYVRVPMGRFVSVSVTDDGDGDGDDEYGSNNGDHDVWWCILESALWCCLCTHDF